jgi:replicative DNA helicase
MARQNADFIIAAELQVLKLFITHPEMDWKMLSVSSFPHKQGKALYTAVNILHESKESITEGSLLREANRLDETIGVSLIETLMEYEVDLSNLNKAMEALKEGATKSNLHRILEKADELAQAHDTLDPTAMSGLLYEAQDAIAESGRRILSKTTEEMISDYEEEMNLRKLGRYYPFNDPFLDRCLLKRAAPGQTILVAGSTGTGKSIYGLTLINGIVNTNIPCMYFSLEMDEVSTMDRWMASRNGIPIDEWYKSGTDLDPLFKVLAREKKTLANKPFRFIDEPSISLSVMRQMIQEFKMTYKVNYLVVFVDLITQVQEFMDIKNSRGMLSTAIEMAVNQLNAMAKKENVCFVCFAQMNREADSTRVEGIEDLDKLRPTLNNIKNSNALGERARTVLSVFRTKYYAMRYLPDDPETENMEDILEVQILKQNMGVVGTRGKYLFTGPIFHLMEIMPEEAHNGT